MRPLLSLVPVERVLNMFMAGMSGVQFLAEVRSRRELRESTFLLMTALRDANVIESAVRYRTDGIILKPFTVAILKEKLASIPKLSDHWRAA